MKTQLKHVLALVLGSLLFTGTQARAISLSFSNIVDATIHFNGDGTFEFLNDVSGLGGRGFKITGSDGIGDSFDLRGSIDGIFTLGTFSGNEAVGYTASVSGLGSLHIYDGTNVLSAVVSWQDIYTYGSGIGLNFNWAPNMSSVSYPLTGSNMDLAALAAAGIGIANVNFDNPEGYSLTQDKWCVSGYNGTLYSESVPDGGMTLALLGAAVAGLAGFRRILNR